MEILKDKKFIIGGLAVVGVIALISYFRKPKRNSDGFFNVSGVNFPTSGIFLPDSFSRKDPFCKVCVQYDKKLSPKGGFLYYKKLYNPSNQISELFSITEQEFVSAFTKNNFCEKNPPKQFINK